jgi:hypothetical protein
MVLFGFALISLKPFHSTPPPPSLKRAARSGKPDRYPMKLTDLYVVEWSERQGCFRVSTMDNLLAANIECYLHQRDPDHSDWMLVGLAPTHAAAHRQLENLKKAMDGKRPG